VVLVGGLFVVVVGGVVVVGVVVVGEVIGLVGIVDEGGLVPSTQMGTLNDQSH
jgi:hypothetical protein